jgi:hypothetical protein
MIYMRLDIDLFNHVLTIADRSNSNGQAYKMEKN